jgi:hypothetical protein
MVPLASWIPPWEEAAIVFWDWKQRNELLGKTSILGANCLA